ncbi:MAG: hypothetical protein NT094_02710, partial [Candidatus Staskawiczbacteria bacterium]|nr:hypothetical protein [Candidatus Staskawiczbacteria bacterium]
MKKQMSSKKIITLIFSILVLCLATIALPVAAWNSPGSTPPDGNVYAPINVGDLLQQRIGPLIINTGGATYGLSLPSGNVGIGTISPSNQLTVYTNTNNSATAINSTSTAGIMITNGSNVDGSYSSLRFNHPNSGDQTYIKSLYHGNNINELVFGGAGGAQDMMKLSMNGGNYNLNTFTIFPTTQGNVGIGGATDKLSKLTVRATADILGIKGSDGAIITTTANNSTTITGSA